jgi:hypothetical protein
MTFAACASLSRIGHKASKVTSNVKAREINKSFFFIGRLPPFEIKLRNRKLWI